MKKIYTYFILVLFVFIPVGVSASERINVTLNKCIDGDTANFNYNNQVITARFLAIDTPETKHPTKGEEPWGKEASNYTCHSLTNAKKIVLEYDDNSTKTDKYNRHLVWVFVDGKMIQKELVTLGYAKVAYLYGDYKYTEDIQKEQEDAIQDKVGMWSDEKSLYEKSKNNNTNTKSKESISNQTFFEEIILFIIFIIILCILFPSFRTKLKRKIKQKTKSTIKNLLK